MMEYFWFLIIGLIGYYWSLPFIILLYPFNIRLFKVSSKRLVNRWKKRIRKLSSISLNGEEPDGFFMGKYFVGFIQTDKYGDVSINVLTYESLFEEVCDNEDNLRPETNSDNSSSTKIKVYEREGSYKHMYYVPRYLDLKNFTPNSIQSEIISNITFQYTGSKVNALSVYMYGRTGTGKTFTTLLLAQRFNSFYCKSFNPREPGDSLSRVYGMMDMSKNRPAIIVLEEVDRIITAIHNQTIPRHKNAPIQTTDKTTWNMFLDDIKLGYYPNLILVMTSNVPRDELNKLDPSYLNDDRVNLVVDFDKRHRDKIRKEKLQWNGFDDDSDDIFDDMFNDPFDSLSYHLKKSG